MKIVILDPYFETLGGGEKVLSVMAEHLAKKNDVTVLVKSKVDKKAVNSYFNVDLDKVNFENIPKEKFLVRILDSSYVKIPGRWKVLIKDRESLRALKRQNADLFINNFYQSNLPSPTAKSIYMCMFPQKLKPYTKYHSPLRRLYNKFTNVLESVLLSSRKDSILSYSVVTANSNYTAGWIKKYWGRDAKILYPVCDDMGPPDAKSNIILSVGRFFADNGSSHHKKHKDLINAFIRLNQPEWQLHIAGSMATDKDSKVYYSELEDLIKDHTNILLHPDMPFAELKKLRQKSTLYWHATGLGYSANTFPENQEHFGMVTAEAMSAGAVPVVYNSAGQIEVVNNGVDGFLWDTIDELIDRSNQLITDTSLRKKMEKAAITRSKDFDRKSFIKHLDDILSEIYTQ